MLSELHSLNLKLCSKQYNKKFVLHLIVAPQLGGGRRHNYSTKTRQAGRANEQSMYSHMSMDSNIKKWFALKAKNSTYFLADIFVVFNQLNFN
jgi:hypothetical protein